jgi:hypothetical protein
VQRVLTETEPGPEDVVRGRQVPAAGAARRGPTTPFMKSLLAYSQARAAPVRRARARSRGSGFAP